MGELLDALNTLDRDTQSEPGSLADQATQAFRSQAIGSTGRLRPFRSPGCRWTSLPVPRGEHRCRPWRWPSWSVCSSRGGDNHRRWDRIYLWRYQRSTFP
jgi:hypothetical protein